jgi:hypothetical protein
MLWFLMACGAEDRVPDDVPVAVVEVPAGPELRHTQDALASDPSAITLSGELVCDRAAGPWTVRLWSLRRSDRDRAPDALPTGEILTELTLDTPGPFSVYSTRSARLLVVGVSSDDPPVLAWGDPHGRYTEAVQDRVGLTLDCAITPTPSPDGSLLSSQGQPVEPERAPVAEGQDPQLDRIMAAPAAPKVDAFRRGGTEINAQDTHSRLKERYQSKLTEEELRLHMIMIYQLADDPKAADEYVNGVVSARDSAPVNSHDPRVIQ